MKSDNVPKTAFGLAKAFMKIALALLLFLIGGAILLVLIL